MESLKATIFFIALYTSILLVVAIVVKTAAYMKTGKADELSWPWMFFPALAWTIFWFL